MLGTCSREDLTPLAQDRTWATSPEREWSVAKLIRCMSQCRAAPEQSADIDMKKGMGPNCSESFGTRCIASKWSGSLLSARAQCVPTKPDDFAGCENCCAAPLPPRVHMQAGVCCNTSTLRFTGKQSLTSLAYKNRNVVNSMNQHPRSQSLRDSAKTGGVRGANALLTTTLAQET